MIQLLKNIAVISAGQGAPQGDNNYCDDGTPFVKAGNLQELIEGTPITNIQKVSEEVAEKHKLKIYPKGTILFAKSGMSCMKGYVYVLPQDAYVVSHLACITPNNDISEYLRYYFKFHKPNQLVKDAAYPSISLADIGNLEIDMKTVTERNNIVAQLQYIEKIITLRQQELQKLDELVKARFVEMFENENYPQATIADLVSGKVSTAKKDFAQEDIIKYIDISSIDNKRNIMTGYTEFIFKEAPSRAQQHIKKGDIVISTVRPNLKNVALTTYEDDNLVASSGFCVLRASKCLPEYLMAIVTSDTFTNDMAKVVTGANYPAIKDSDIMRYPVMVAPLETQKVFSNFVNQIDKSKFVNEKIQLKQLYILITGRFHNDYNRIIKK